MEGTLNTAEFRDSSTPALAPGHTRRIAAAGAVRGAILVAAACAAAVFGLAACNQAGTAPGAKQHASVLLRDGSTVTGTVTASSGSEITLAGDDNQTHTLQMAQ